MSWKNRLELVVVSHDVPPDVLTTGPSACDSKRETWVSSFNFRSSDDNSVDSDSFQRVAWTRIRFSGISPTLHRAVSNGFRQRSHRERDQNVGEIFEFLGLLLYSTRLVSNHVRGVTVSRENVWIVICLRMLPNGEVRLSAIRKCLDVSTLASCPRISSSHCTGMIHACSR